MSKKILEKLKNPLLSKYKQGVRNRAIKNTEINLKKFGKEKKLMTEKEYLDLLTVEEEQIKESNINKALTVGSLLLLGMWF